MKQRVISGAVLVVILAITLYFGGIVTCGLMALVSLVGNMELLRVYGGEQEDSGNRVLPGDSSVLYSHIPESYGHYCSYDGRIFIGYACCVCADIPNIQR